MRHFLIIGPLNYSKCLQEKEILDHGQVHFLFCVNIICDIYVKTLVLKEGQMMSSKCKHYSAVLKTICVIFCIYLCK